MLRIIEDDGTELRAESPLACEMIRLAQTYQAEIERLRGRCGHVGFDVKGVKVALSVNQSLAVVRSES